MQTIAITGGKGGTGKTLIATNFAVQLANDGYSVLLIDSDVENPNTNILLGFSLRNPKVESSPVEIFTPKFDPALCTKCGQCKSACYRHAILQFPDQLPEVMDNMCNGCETCSKICPENAISSKGRTIGHKYYYPKAMKNLDVVIGELNPGEAVSVLIVEDILRLSNKIQKKNIYDIIIIDTAPGAHCDVEASLNAADMIVAVTEPTPFGLHDLNRILKLVELNGHSASIILNRADLTEYKTPITDLLKQKNLSLLGEIPIDKLIVENYARGNPFVNDPRNFPGKLAFNSIYLKIIKKLWEKD